jgi:hypothetical protein
MEEKIRIPVAICILLFGILAIPLYSGVVRCAVIPPGKTGIPSSIDELLPEAIPDQENAALLYKQAGAMRQALGRKYSEEWKLFPYEGTVDWNKVSHDEKKMVSDLILNDPEFVRFFNALEKATTMKCQFYAKEEYKQARGAPETMLGHLAKLRSFARLLATKAKLEGENGDYEKALQTSLSGLRLGESLSNEPLLTSQLVRMAITAIVLNNIEGFLSDIQGEMVSYKPLMAQFREERKRNLTFYGLKGELVICGLPQFSRKESSKTLEGQKLTYLQTMTEAILLSEKPYWKAREEIKRLDERIQKMPKKKAALAQLLVASVPKVFLRAAGDDAMLGNAELAIALKIYKARHGNYPDNLSGLVPEITPELPEDPFSGKNHKYHRVGEGFIVYSVGDNWKDDGGIPAKEKHFKGDFDYVWKCGR